MKLQTIQVKVSMYLSNIHDSDQVENLSEFCGSEKVVARSSRQGREHDSVATFVAGPKNRSIRVPRY